MKHNKLVILFCAIVLLGSVIFPMVPGIQIETELVGDPVTEGKIIDLEPLDDLPSYFSWRDRDGVDFSTPVKNQYAYPSCESFALTSALAEVSSTLRIMLGPAKGKDVPLNNTGV